MNACFLQKKSYLCTRNYKEKRLSIIAFAEIAQLVEHNLAKVRVASSSLVFRSIYTNVFVF